MFRKIFVPLIVIGGLLATAVSAHSAAICGNRAQLVGALSHDFSEQPSFEAVTLDGKLMEVLTSEKGTWTVLITTPEGLTCVVAAGTAWEALRKLKIGPTA